LGIGHVLASVRSIDAVEVFSRGDGISIGQGLTGMSTLALGSLIALASIIVGAVWGLKALEEGSTISGLKAMLTRA
jgi:hypothetical protein